jgi:hypothetical protein
MKKLLLTSLFIATLSALSTGCGDIEVPEQGSVDWLEYRHSAFFAASS